MTFGSSGTLELNSSGTLTLTTALAIGAGTVQLDGASSALTDTTGISLSTAGDTASCGLTLRASSTARRADGADNSP